MNDDKPYTEKKQVKLFRNYDGMFLYLRPASAWSHNPKIIETNDPIEAYLNEVYGLYRLVKETKDKDGELVTATIELKITIEPK